MVFGPQAKVLVARTDDELYAVTGASADPEPAMAARAGRVSPARAAVPESRGRAFTVLPEPAPEVNEVQRVAQGIVARDGRRIEADVVIEAIGSIHAHEAKAKG